MSNHDENLFSGTFLLEIVKELNANVYITDIETNHIVYMNDTMKKDFRLDHPEGKVCWQVLQENMSERCQFCRISELLQNGGKGCLWVEENTKTGKVYQNYDRLIENEGKKYFVQCSSDVTEFTKMSRTARTDELTSMLNRRAGKEKLIELIDMAKDKEKIITVVLCDVNQLKKINDLYGHIEGDRLLRYFSSIIRQNISKRDLVFRLSGDEFVLAFYDKDAKEAEKKVQWVKKQLKEEKNSFSVQYEVSFSYGLMEIYPEDQYILSDIISRADERMYLQKRDYHIKQAKMELQQVTENQAVTDFEYDKDHLYDALSGSVDDYVFVGNMKTGTFRYPPAMVEAFGLPGEVVENAAAFWSDLIHPHDEKAFLESNQEIADGRTNYHDIEYRAKNVKGEWIWLRCRGRMITNQEGEPYLFAGMITNQGKKDKTDHMTGLFNKYEFEGAVKEFLVNENAEKMGIMILNLDSFKNINDFYDQSFGDEILRITAQKIQSMLPPAARLYRLDGDQFGIFMPGSDENEGLAVFGRIQRTFYKQQEHNGRKYFCTLSAGYVSYPKDGDNYLDLLKYAHYSLEYSKLMGKNRITLFSDDILYKKARTLELNQLLRESIDRGFIGFSVHYQPQIDSCTGEVYGAEALARWHCTEYGDVSPIEFIPLLEQNGLIVQLGKWVFEQAAHQCKKWSRVKDDFHMSVNLSYRQLLDGTILDFMQATLHEINLDPSKITMELTETYLIEENSTLRKIVDGMQDLGIQIAMDDFGKGYSSLFSLKTLPVDIVKIDRGFVKNINTDLFNATFVRTITELCHGVGKKVCLEGVETEIEYNAIKDKGIELIQGFFFGRPVPADVFESLFFQD